MAVTEDAKPGWLARLRGTPAAVENEAAEPDPGRRRAEEEAIELELTILDAQHHFADDSQPPFTMPDLLTVLRTSGHRVVGTIFVEAGFRYRPDGPEELRPVGEVEAVRTLAESADRTHPGLGPCRGIVGHADLILGDRVAGVLDALATAAGGRLCGIRDVAAWDADPRFRFGPPFGAPAGMLLDDRFQAGVQRLERYDLVFNATVFGPQLPELATLARACPSTRIVVEHAGLPLWVRQDLSRDAVLETWRSNLAELASLPNVFMKIGNLPQQRSFFVDHGPGSDVLAAAWRPYIDACVDAFSPERSMLESDLTVQAALCNYTVLWNAFKKATAHYAPTEREFLFHRTALAVYGLDGAAL